MTAKPAAAKPAAKQPAKKVPAAKPAPKAAAILDSDLLPASAATEWSPKGDYRRVLVGGRPLGYVSDRRAGKLVEVLTSRLVGARPALLKDTTARQNQTALMVTDKATATRARKLFAHAASTVPQVGGEGR